MMKINVTSNVKVIHFTFSYLTDIEILDDLNLCDLDTLL